MSGLLKGSPEFDIIYIFCTNGAYNDIAVRKLDLSDESMLTNTLCHDIIKKKDCQFVLRCPSGPGAFLLWRSYGRKGVHGA